VETVDLIDANALIKQGNSIVLKKQYKKVCKNVKEMSYKELISHLMKELMGYAMSLTLKNEFNADGLVQTTLVKLIKNKEKLMALEHPVAYAKMILKNSYIDKYRKEIRLVSIEANNIPVFHEGFQEEAFEFQEMLNILVDFDETDRTILIMLGIGNSYEEIQEVVGEITLENLRLKAHRARIELAKRTGRKL
tara:strand:- start:896 stop:1474 length:579 start_codon:yes stop_codon:yes gene_type:complete